MRPNVLYELGVAHGRDKVAILLNRRGAFEGDVSVPFDLFTQHRLEYTKPDEHALDRLKTLIGSVTGARR